MEDFTYYVVALVAAVVLILVVKKVASCLIRSVVTLVVLGLLAWIYFTYLR